MEKHKFEKVDVVGDVHGCFDELVSLVEKLGYESGSDGLFRHPEGRHLAFVGDLVDRGPKNRAALNFALTHCEAGVASMVQGNHDNKFARWLKGNEVTVGHGLGATVAEFENVSESEKLKLSETILALPLFETFDGGKLLVCHAAPPPKNAGRGKVKSTCLYGHTTGRTDERGFPERLNWVPAYCENSEEDDPFVVYGHVAHEEAYVTEKACCIDTASFAGNKLSAFRWPEREVVSVDSQQEWDEGANRKLVLHDRKEEKTPVLRPVRTNSIQNMSLEYLLGKLRDGEEDVLYLIDTDELLKKRERTDGLVIANATKALFEPAVEHQLYAKGIVYKRDPYKLVSLPLVKMYNHGRREFSDETSNRYERDPEVRFVFPEKMDGSLIQVFEHDGEVIFTTRSVMEGVDLPELDSFPYLGEARAIAVEKHPKILDPEFVRGKTLLLELISPQARIVTDYGDRRELTLLSVFDLSTYSYWTTARIDSYAEEHGLGRFEVLAETTDLTDGVQDVLDALEDAPNVPEGAIVCFEKDGQVVHRVKVKTQEYLEYFRLKYQCTFKSVVEMIWNRTDLHDWDTFVHHLRDNRLTEEEIEMFYKEHFDEFMSWKAECEIARDEAIRAVEAFDNSYAGDPKDKGAYYKSLALHGKTSLSDVFSFVMEYARNGELPFDSVMRARAPYPGFKGIVDEWRKAREDQNA